MAATEQPPMNTVEKMRTRLSRLRERTARVPKEAVHQLAALEAEALDLERQLAEQEG